jgi:hypothetical protein
MDLLGKLFKTAIHTVTAPVEIVKDIATLCGALTDEDESYTAKRIRKLAKDANEIEEAVDDL